MQVCSNLSHYLIWIFSPVSSLLNPQFFSVDFCLYLCGALSSHQTPCRCADGQISRWKKKSERERGREVDVCFWASSVAAAAAAGRWGEGRFERNVGSKGPLSPSPFAFSSLLFSSLSFLSLLSSFPVLRLGVTAPVLRLMFEPSRTRGERFVCFDDCQQTLLSGWKCLTTVCSPLQAAAERTRVIFKKQNKKRTERKQSYGHRSPLLQCNKWFRWKNGCWWLCVRVPSCLCGAEEQLWVSGDWDVKVKRFYDCTVKGKRQKGDLSHSTVWNSPWVKNVTCLGLLAMLAGKSWNVWNGGRWCFCSYLTAWSSRVSCSETRHVSRAYFFFFLSSFSCAD